MSKLNVKNRTIFNKDNLDILEGINSECIDLIYLDPPFNKKKIFTAPIGTSAEGASFSDIFREEDIKDEWVKSIETEAPELYEYLKSARTFSDRYSYCYLVYMAIRLLECQRILKDSGSLYLHCDPTMSHYLKIVLDCIFGARNFIDEIIWNYGTPSGGRVGGKKPVKTHDVLLCYAKKYGQHTYNIQFTPYSEEYVSKWFRHISKDRRRYQTRSRNGKIIRQYLDESPGVPLSNTWNDIKQLYGQSGWFPTTQKKEITGYPTQKPLLLLERVINASSNEDDVVLDPFCGCATTCVAAEKLTRQWIGIDISYKAYELVKERLCKEVQPDIWEHKTLIFDTAPPKKTGTDAASEKGFVYIISHPLMSGYKVGIARDIKRRLNSYQTADAERSYKLEYSAESSKFKEIEKDIHSQFTRKHEWVQADLAAIITAIKNLL